MFPHELIGKKAIRTKPIQHQAQPTFGLFSLGEATEGRLDYSHTSSPIEIVKATKTHIIYRYPDDEFMAAELNRRPHILDHKWIDDNWIDYDVLLQGVEQTTEADLTVDKSALPN